MEDIKNKQSVNITNSSNVNIGDIKNTVNFNTSSESNEGEITKIFLALMEKANALSNMSDRQDAQNAIKALKAEAQKNDNANDKKVKKWLYFLAETAPDIGEVAIDTFLNPIKGLSTVFRKVAERAKAEREKQSKSNLQAKTG